MRGRIRASLVLVLLTSALTTVLPPQPAQAATGDFHSLIVTASGGLWHDMRRNGVWTGFGDVGGQVPLPGRLVDVAAVSIGDDLHVVVANDAGDVYHAIRNDGGWTGFGDVENQSGDIGFVRSVAVANVNGNLNVVALGRGIHHAIRFASGSPAWTRFGNVELEAGTVSGATDVAASGFGTQLHVTVASPSTWRLAYAIRQGSGAWSSFAENVYTAAGFNMLAGAPTTVATAMVNGELHLVMTSQSRRNYYTVRSFNGIWGAGNVLGQYLSADQVSAISSIAIAGRPGQMMVSESTTYTNPSLKLWRTDQPCQLSPLRGSLSAVATPGSPVQVAMAAQT